MGTPLVAALHGKHFRIAELLHRHGADVNARFDSFFTPLHVASITGTSDVVQWLLNHGADVNAQHNQLCTPIGMAIHFGHLQVVRMLIECNADIEVQTKFGSPLHQATSGDRGGQVGIMQILLDRGANPNARDNGGSTPLHSLAKGYPGTSTFEMTHLLLKYGAIIDSEDNEGRTPLQLALEYDRQDIETCLREHGAMR